MTVVNPDAGASFIVPVLNGSPVEADSVKSILTQPWRRLEVVCIGGPDALARLAASTPLDPRLKHLRIEADTTGVAKTLNQGAATACGDALFFVCRPVLMFSEFTEVWMDRLLAGNGVALVYGDFLESVSSSEARVRYTRTGYGDFSEASRTGPVRGIPREVFNARGGYDESLDYAYDYDLRMRLLETGHAVRVSTPLYRIPWSDPPAATRSRRHSWCYTPSGHWHQWSYLFYGAVEEREFKAVCENALKRLGAFLQHREEPVDCPHASATDPSISVIIPVWNRRDYILAAVESVASGSWQSWEIIAVDNGSTDGSVEILERLRVDGLIRLYHSRRDNTAAALNMGVRHARGKYICQLDSDDLFTPDTLAVLHQWMEAHPDAALGVSYYDHIGAGGETLTELGVVKHHEYDRNNLLRTDGLGAARIWHRCIVELLGGFDEENLGSYAEDYDLYLKLSERFRVLRIPRVLYRYRHNHKTPAEGRNYVERHEKKTFARRAALERRRRITRQRSPATPRIRAS